MAANEIKIVIGGDPSSFIQASQQSAAAAKGLQDAVNAAAVKIDTAAETISHSFDEVAAGKAAMERIAASIDAAADAALKAVPKFDSIALSLPITDFRKFTDETEKLKQALSKGLQFKILPKDFVPPKLPPVPQIIPPDLPEKLNKTRDASRSASTALLGLSRVAQDAPFGFVGIVNNLTELPGLFQNLGSAAKESGQSVKSLVAASLLGPAGLGVALSLITSALTFATVGFGAWTRGFTDSAKASSEAKKEAKELAKALKDVSLTQAEATASVEGQIAQVNALAVVVSDSNKPYTERKRALDELKNTNKNYFGDLQLEDSLTGKLAKTINEYSAALVNAAIQKEFASEIANVAKQIAKVDSDITKSRVSLIKTEDAVFRKRFEAQKASQAADGTYMDTKVSLIALENKENDINEEINAKNETRNQLISQQKDLYDSLNKAVAEGQKFKKLEADGAGKEEDLLKKRLEAIEKIKAATKDATQLVGLQEAIFELQVKIAIRDQGKNQLTKQELDQSIKGFQDQLNEAFQKQAIELELSPKARFSDVVLADISFKEVESKIAKATGLDKKIVLPTQFEIDLRFNGKEFADSAERARQQIEGIKAALLNGIVSGLQEGSALVGEAFANIFNGESVGASMAKAAEGMLGIVGGVLQEVGKQILLTSALVAALKRALDGLFGPGGEAIAAGVGLALIATGALLKSIKFDVPKLADGGIATRATLGIFGEAGKEAIIPLDKLPEMLGRISTNNQQPIVLNGNLRLDGTDLELALERVRSRRSRLG